MLLMKKQLKKLKDDVDNYSATGIQRAFRDYKTRKTVTQQQAKTARLKSFKIQ